MQLEWNVLFNDFNSDKIVKYNIFYNGWEKEVLKNNPKTLSELKEEITKWAKYHYWCKTEFEIAVGGLFSKYPEKFEKIDIYRQIEMNLDRITEYIYRNLIKKENKNDNS